MTTEPEAKPPEKTKPKTKEGTFVNHLKLANSVKIGHNEMSYFTSEGYDLNINGLIIKIVKKDKVNSTVYTSVMNAISWQI